MPERRAAEAIDQLAAGIPEIAENSEIIKDATYELIGRYALIGSFFDSPERTLYLAAIADSWHRNRGQNSAAATAEQTYLEFCAGQTANYQHLQQISPDQPLTAELYAAYRDDDLTETLTTILEGPIFDMPRQRLEVTAATERPYNLHVLKTPEAIREELGKEALQWLYTFTHVQEQIKVWVQEEIDPALPPNMCINWTYARRLHEAGSQGGPEVALESTTTKIRHEYVHTQADFSTPDLLHAVGRTPNELGADLFAGHLSRTPYKHLTALLEPYKQGTGRNLDNIYYEAITTPRPAEHLYKRFARDAGLRALLAFLTFDPNDFDALPSAYLGGPTGLATLLGTARPQRFVVSPWQTARAQALTAREQALRTTHQAHCVRLVDFNRRHCRLEPISIPDYFEAYDKAKATAAEHIEVVKQRFREEAQSA